MTPLAAASPPESVLDRMPDFFDARMPCDKAGTFSELRDNILQAKPFTSSLSLICGTERGEVARIEKPEQGMATCVRPTKGTPLLALSNHYIHRNHRSLNTETEWEDEDGQVWMNDTKERFCEVHRLAQEAEGCACLPGLGRFEEEPVHNEHTVHLALMRPATTTLKFKNYSK